MSIDTLFFHPLHPQRTVKLEAEIQHVKSTVRRAVVEFSCDLEQGHAFSAGTYENIIADRYAEMDEFFGKLDKIKRSIPTKLIKQMNAFILALTVANKMKNELQQYVFLDIGLSQLSITDVEKRQFIRANQAAAKKYHDAVRHLLLQKKLSLHIQEMNCLTNRIQHLHAYALDPLDLQKLTPILDDLAEIERNQRKERYKSIAGLTLRVIGWGIMIFATIIALNPAVGYLILGVSIVLTIIGELINVAGKKLREPTILQEQLFEIRDAQRLFKNKPLEVNADKEIKPENEFTRTDSPSTSS
jgi:hypothetical protein